MIQQSANPDATNSELDAKKIINNVQLNNDQLSRIKRDFAELVVDNMDTKDLVRYVYADLMESYCKCTQNELEEYVYNYDEELWEELVDNVTQQYPKQNPTFHMDQAFDKAHKEV